MRIAFIFFTLLTASILAAESEEIRVQLATESTLQPAYVGALRAEQSVFDMQHLLKLEQILLFDLNNNGSTYLVKKDTDKEKQLLLTDRSNALNPHFWKCQGISYAVQWQVSQSTLSASVLNTATGHVSTFGSISLTGDIAHDRKQIHRLADGIHQALFHEEGIASQRILFAYQTKNALPNGKEWVSEIYECDVDGANIKQLTHDNSYCVTPVAVPHAKNRQNPHFLYVSYKIGQPKIYLGSRKGDSPKRLIDLRGNQLLPTISPQRDKIAFICDAGGRTDLFLQAFDPEKGESGKPVQLYSYPRSTQASPTFSPDGSKIAFVSDKDGGMRIFLIPTTITDKRPNAVMISKQNRENSCPAWSPDGKKIAYSAKTNLVRQIWIYDFATQEEWQLTDGPGHKENPAWAPNSKHLVFNSSDTSGSELYIINLNQKEAVKISHGPGKKHYPCWAN